MRSIIVAIAIVLLSACCPCRHLTASMSDSVRVEVRERIVPVVRDTTIYIPIEREVERVVADSCSILSNRWAISHAKLQGGKLYHSLETTAKTAEFTAKTESQIIYRDSIVYRDRKTTEVREVYRLRWWQSALCWVGAIVLFAVGMWGAFKVGRFGL